MFSPGSLGASTTNSLVALDRILRHTIMRAEKILLSAKSKSNNSPLSNRVNLMRKIFEVRILISRLLIVLRWSKSMHVADIINNLFSGPEVHINSTFTEILHSNSGSCLKPLDMKIPAVTYVLPNKIPIDRKRAFCSLLMREVPKRIKSIFFVGHCLTFVSPGEYSFVLKVDNYGNFKLKSYRISWPKLFEFPQSCLMNLTHLLTKFTSQLNLALPRIDRVLHQIFLCGAYTNIVNSLLKIQNNFPIYIERGHYIKFKFPELFGLSSCFYMYIKMGRILITSSGTIYLPPNSLADSLIPLETFNRFNEDENDGKNDQKTTNSHQITFQLQNDFDEYELLFAFLRDVVFYTKLIKIWNTTIHSIRSVAFSYFQSRCIYNSKMSTLSRIETHLRSIDIVTITIDAWSGVMRLNFSADTGMESTDMTLSLIEPEEIYRLMSKVLSNFAIHTSVENVYGTKCSPSVFLKNPKLYSRCFSFAPDFSLHIQSEFGHPRVFIFDNNFNQYTNPDIIEIASSPIVHAWKQLAVTLRTSKSLIFLLQTQKCLSDLGVHSMRSGSMLEIRLPSCRTCRLFGGQNGWKMMFSPDSSLGVMKPEPISIFRGFAYTARAAQSLSQTILNIQKCRLNMYNIIMLSDQTMAIEKPHLFDQYSLYFRFNTRQKNSLYMNFDENLVSGGSYRDVSYYTLSQISFPKIQFQFACYSPIQKLVNNLAESSDSFLLSSFINQAAIPLFRFYEVFCSDNNDFVISNLMAAVQFCLIYKKRFTFSVRLKPVHSYLLFIASYYPHILLILPISLIKKSTPFPAKRLFEVSMGSLVAFRDILVKFIAFYEEIEHQKFKFRGFSEGMDQAKYVLEKPNCRILLLLMGNRFMVSIDCSPEITEVMKSFSVNVGLDVEFLRGIVHSVVNLLSATALEGGGNVSIILNLLKRIKNECNFEIDIISKALQSVTIEEAGSVMITVKDFNLRFEKLPDQLKISFFRNGSTPKEAQNFQELLNLINQY